MPPPNSPSNPVAPTIVLLEKGASDAPAPVARPVTCAGQVAAALSAAAAALAAVADALAGGNGAIDSLSLTPLPAPRRPVAADALTVHEVVNEFLIAKARAGRSDRYLRQLRVSLASFAKGRAGAALRDLTVSDLEKWVYGQGWKPKTMRGYLADVRTLFHFAVRRGYATGAEACAVELPGSAAQVQPPGVHTPAQVAQVLETARRADLDVCRHLALRYFTGVRSAEAHRMTEANILADRGFVEVPAHKAKTRRRRLVSIQPAFAAWLALGGVLRPLSPDTVRRVIRLSNVDWPANVTRHCFVSYHLAAFESAAKTALEAGHSETMLFAHYRAVVTREAALEFWAIRPTV
jgi:integrase